jgi:hypothetical protein
VFVFPRVFVVSLLAVRAQFPKCAQSVPSLEPIAAYDSGDLSTGELFPTIVFANPKRSALPGCARPDRSGLFFLRFWSFPWLSPAGMPRKGSALLPGIWQIILLLSA